MNMTENTAAGTGMNKACHEVKGSPDEFSRWWRTYRHTEHPQSRLICLPHAGGGASFYRKWAGELPSSIELAAIQYPGHEDRMAEPLVNSMPELVSGICDSISCGGLLSLPYMIFGHSMGGYVAYELCREIRRRGLEEPYHVFVSASEAPGMKEDSSWHTCSDEELLSEVRRVYGDSSICQDREIAGMFLPVIRNDYELIEKWHPNTDSEPFRISLSSFYADGDSEMNPAKAEGWKKVTSRNFETRRFNGNHFYLLKHQHEILKSVVVTARHHCTKRLMLP